MMDWLIGVEGNMKVLKKRQLRRTLARATVVALTPTANRRPSSKPELTPVSDKLSIGLDTHYTMSL